MKKVFKGCLWSIGLLVIGSLIIYFYATSPNKITFTESPIEIERDNYNLSFENRQIPDIIINQNGKNILYQAYIEEISLDLRAIYKIAIQLEKDIELENSMPINNLEKERLNKYIDYNKINNSFKPILNLPDNNKSGSGKHIQIYYNQKEIELNLKNGSYTYLYDDIDKVGSVSEVIFYDKDSKILYYERNRYHAFQ